MRQGSAHQTHPAFGHGVAISYGYTPRTGKVTSLTLSGGSGLPSFGYDYTAGTVETSKLHTRPTAG